MDCFFLQTQTLSQEIACVEPASIQEVPLEIISLCDSITVCGQTDWLNWLNAFSLFTPLQSYSVHFKHPECIWRLCVCVPTLSLSSVFWEVREAIEIVSGWLLASPWLSSSSPSLQTDNSYNQDSNFREQICYCTGVKPNLSPFPNNGTMRQLANLCP